MYSVTSALGFGIESLEVSSRSSHSGSTCCPISAGSHSACLTHAALSQSHNVCLCCTSASAGDHGAIPSKAANSKAGGWQANLKLAKAATARKVEALKAEDDEDTGEGLERKTPFVKVRVCPCPVPSSGSNQLHCAGCSGVVQFVGQAAPRCP